MTFKEAEHEEVWKKAMQEEYQSIMKNGVWEIVPKPSDKLIVTSKWIYKIKHAVDGSIDKYKARFVARGFSQKGGIDYEETFAPTARYTTIRSLVSLATTMGWNIHKMDVKTAFLIGTIDEEVYIEQPKGFEVNSRESHVCRLKKALYGLKQAPRAWYARMDKYLLRTGFVKSTVDPNLYIKVVNNGLVIILLYVDDLFITGVARRIQECKKTLAAEFEMKDLGLMHYYLGLEVWQRLGELYLGQGKYIIKLLQKFGIMESKPMVTPMITNLKKLRSSNSSLVDPTSYRQLVAVEHVLRYLRGTIRHCLKYDSKEVKLIGFTDSDWGGSETDGRSTIGGCFTLGVAMVSWMSRNQDPVALSSAKAKYVAACEVGKEVVWLRKLLIDLFERALGPNVINCDNQSCIKMFGDLVFHSRTKHIKNKFHFIRNLVQDRIVKLEYVPIDE
eukprot:PITA_14487